MKLLQRVKADTLGSGAHYHDQEVLSVLSAGGGGVQEHSSQKTWKEVVGWGTLDAAAG